MMTIVAIGLLAFGILLVCIMGWFMRDEGGIIATYLGEYDSLTMPVLLQVIAAACFWGATKILGISLFNNETTDIVAALVIAFVLPIIIYNILATPTRIKKNQEEEKLRKLKEKEAREKAVIEEQAQEELRKSKEKKAFEIAETEKRIDKASHEIRYSAKYKEFTEFVDNNSANIISIDYEDRVSVRYSQTEPIFIKDYATQQWVYNTNVNAKTMIFFGILHGERNWTTDENIAIQQLVRKYMQDKSGFNVMATECHRLPPNEPIVSKRPY